MTNPEKNLKEYLKILVRNYIFLNSILDEVNDFHSWYEKNGGDRSINAGS